MTIGGRIKQARKAGNFSLRKLADEIGVSAMAISKYERNQDVSSSGVLLRLSQALKVKVDFFFRPSTVSVQLQAYRKHAVLGVKEQEAIQMRIQGWVERHLEVESLFPEEQHAANLPLRKVTSPDDIETAALELRDHWSLGYDAIENLVQLLEDRGIKVGIISGFEHFDACTFKADGDPVIVTKANYQATGSDSIWGMNWGTWSWMFRATSSQNRQLIGLSGLSSCRLQLLALNSVPTGQTSTSTSCTCLSINTA